MDYNKILIEMIEFVDVIDSQNTFKPKSIMEIGSMDGRDARMLEEKYKTNNVYVIEPHSKFYNNIKNENPNFKVFNFAASNVDGVCEFNEITTDSPNLGVSSMLKRDENFPSNGATYNVVQVITKRLDTFINEQNITEIDILKVDVEGNSYEVIDGFGEKLKMVKIIHIENEHITIWKNQKLYCDVEKLLINNGFILVTIKCGWPQTDSIWVRKELYNHSWFL